MKHPHDQARDAVLAWYDRHARVLPWRAPPGAPYDPYRVWLSEIMLQQTTVQAVKPYFEAFTARWPSVTDLARADLSEVLSAWAGLGYYSRARNLHKAARQVAEAGGAFPDTAAGLRQLPGVGPYTAAAIAAIAFDEPIVPADGNIERVTARVFAIDAPLPGAKPLLREKAQVFAGSERPGDLAQALMDLGATICTPRDPACALCPVNDVCEGFKSGIAATLPVKAAKAERPRRAGAAFVVTRAGGELLVRSRPPKGLLGGMSEVPTSAWRSDFDCDGALSAAPLDAEFSRLSGSVRHVFTHFALDLTVYRADVAAGTKAPGDARWVAPDDMRREAFPTVMKKVLAHAGISGAGG